MNIIKAFPVISALLGCFLTFFIIQTKNSFGKNNVAKYSLALLVFLYTLTCIGNYIDANHYDAPLYLGFINFISFTFVGVTFYYFCASIVDRKIRFKPIVLIIVAYGIFKTCFFIYLVRVVGDRESIYELLKEPYEPIVYYAVYDYIASCLFNLFFIYRAFILFKTTPFMVSLNTQKEIYFKWINLLFFINFAVIFFLMTLVILVLFGIGSLEFVLKIEPILYTIYFFAFVYSLMYFPVFAFTGDYNDLPTNVKEKYKNSSLINSEELFKKVDRLVTEEKMFLSPELKINTLSERLETSVPHISQAINENKNISFSDYINGFRIDEAKKRLLVKKPDTIFAIAIDVGFNSKATFYHAFKKLTNTTPTEFRKHHVKDMVA
ncbi:MULTISPECIES: helix-turn-helix domain-containing protein [unclassified Tenacibaculum]|uniref:helix-turn-helix domain-containing protein n=1 Tax=unclassified Tenacibaculum TaxID=2635139 RepID=UPI001F1938D8|nr:MULTISPECIES: helix-turn-helix domain-containing protein [unclassified Tenacibaculum]MCF2874722.1 helix-turn-helix domain-containing protein [Tenacibaculum sp. Cn5-1]MCF2934212.1 helix-turn-helix domain-containing protein [Tenacibaculum sp. Cn5-34]MCG7510422.1 helix-turn-helix domain-containing protein [Tenacibaculum sp. Cn5-46]